MNYLHVTISLPRTYEGSTGVVDIAESPRRIITDLGGKNTDLAQVVKCT